MSGEQKVKEGDEIIRTLECSNADELLFFTDKQQVYKSKVNDFPDSKASVLGEFCPSKLEMEEEESVVYMALLKAYKGYMIFAFDNGKVAKVDISAYKTKTNRKKLLKAYSNKAQLVQAEYIEDDTQIVLVSSSGKMLILNTALVASKATKDTVGVNVMTLKKNQTVVSFHHLKEGEFEKEWRFRAKNLPASGALPSANDLAEQITF